MFSSRSAPTKPRAVGGLGGGPRRSRGWAIIADDVTGATDVAAAFVHAGFSAQVVLNRRTRQPFPADVIILSSDTRQGEGAEAARRVAAACQWLHRRGRQVIYKKLDSTLQGHIVAEVQSIRDSAGFASAVVCPANPRQGRRIVGGCLSVRGEVRGSVADQLLAQGMNGYEVAHRPLGLVRLMAACRRCRFLLADGASRRDLRLLARAALGTGALPAGSAALAAEVAALLARRGGPAKRNFVPPPSGSPNLPTLLVCGTTNPVTARQFRVLRAAGALEELRFPQRIGARWARALAGGGNVVLRVPVHERPAAQILQWLQSLTPWLENRLIGSWLLTGGDTALLVCRWLRPCAINIGGEISAGLAWGRWQGGLADGLPVCTKPGGFGDEQCLVRAVRFLRGGRELARTAPGSTPAVPTLSRAVSGPKRG